MLCCWLYLDYRKELNLEEIQEIELEEVDESVKVLLKGQHINRNNEEEGITVFKVFEFGNKYRIDNLHFIH